MDGATAAKTGSYDDPLHRVIAEIRSERRTEERLKRLEADVHRGQEEALERAAKKARREKPCTFKKKSHQIQYDFNERVAECIETARDEAKKPASETTMTKMTKALEEGMELLVTRQKLIKLADRSEYGWQVVAEYEEDELASGSEDEKKIERAEKAAERKAQRVDG